MSLERYDLTLTRESGSPSAFSVLRQHLSHSSLVYGLRSRFGHVEGRTRIQIVSRERLQWET